MIQDNQQKPQNDDGPLYCNFVFTLQRNGLHVHKANNYYVNVGKNAKQTPGNAEETVNIVTATDLNHLNDWIIQERITVMLLRDAK